jgi:mono/diheme cytochrome c family protein
LIRDSRRRSSSTRRATVVALAIAAFGLPACTDAAGYDLDYLLGRVSFLSTMRSTVAYKPQQLPRLPPEGTVPVASPMGDVPSPFTQAELASVGAELQNPLPATAEVLARGAVVYRNQCATCHGATGAGDGPVVGAGRFPFAPPVNAGAAVAQSDGYHYAIIRVGRGLMPAYGERITHEDRWAVVHYMRQLQGAPAPDPTPGQPAALGISPLPRLAPTAPALAPGAPAVDPAAPGVAPGATDVSPTAPGVAPVEPLDPGAPAADPVDPADPAAPAVDPQG